MTQLPGLRRRKFIGFLLVLTVAVLLRCAHVDNKVFWGDEVYSSLRVFGHTTAQMHRQIAMGQSVAAPELQQFQQRSPDKNIDAVVNALIAEDSHLPPLYFLLLRVWADWFGASAIAIRSLSVLFSLITLPVIYWLAIELFGRTQIAMLAVVLSAVSPMQLLFAQEGRFYSFWTLTTTLAAATLLRALRLGRWHNWGQFALAASALLYSHLLGMVTLAGYGLYVLIMTWRRNWHALQRFILAMTVAALSFAPWFWIFLTSAKDEPTEFKDALPSVTAAIKNLFFVISRSFADFNLDATALPWQSIAVSLCSWSIVALLGFAIYRLMWQSKLRSWLFIVLLLCVTLLPVLPLSLKSALPPRYLVPSYVALPLILAAALGTPGMLRRWVKIGLVGFLVTVGLFSCATIVNAETWWNKEYSNCNLPIAAQLRQSSRPLVVSDGDGRGTFDHALSNVVSLARLAPPETQFQVFLETQLPDRIELAEGMSDRFLVTPSAALLTQLQKQYPGQVKPLIAGAEGYRNPSNYCLWRLPADE
ncbi:glycosyltransferase family 39 protein [filamentous cyanobacterium LEGE 11480]|uniref:Glycosyltransferase family 39 protein n=1 Tax=Romeriopsis navalis LEGE 11480 TaxID=2777977 RepID=A0A928VHP3_9CYAN|nr:glycosyltransferase family 39 protein [Romeriopsis navalis]MBE9028798.1 glycosyltransferase family 39 protein [Romeriopsis navalis LEGE 11480]